VKRVAIFGNAGAGKSTLGKRLATATGLPLYPIDLIAFRVGGGAVPHDEYLRAHGDLLTKDEWMIEGYGSVASAWERFAKADTLVYIDLPVARHYWWVTKRAIKGVFANPEGWPENSPIWSSTVSSYKVVWRCHRLLTPRYRRLIADSAADKQVHHLRSRRDIAAFFKKLGP